MAQLAERTPYQRFAFESSQRQNFKISIILTLEKIKIKKKRSGMAHFKNFLWRTFAQVTDDSIKRLREINL